MFKSLLAWLKKIPLSVFLGVLLFHACVVWWMLGARIELPARPAFDPIIVTLEKADPEFEKLDLEKAEPTVRSE